MPDEFIDVEVTQPGRPIGQYKLLNSGGLKLEEIYYPQDRLPFDLGVLPHSLTSDGENLQVILLGEVSHPPATLIPSRLVGGVQVDGSGFYLLAVPVAERRVESLAKSSELLQEIRTELASQLGRLIRPETEMGWIGLEDVQTIIRQAYILYRQLRSVRSESNASQSAWKPLDRNRRKSDYSDSKHYTDAEYTFFQLPFQFQKYVSMYLADDERILYAVQRPAMDSQLHRSLLRRKRLQEGVLILTTQQLLNLVELIPPDRSGIRYGFNAQVGILERLDGAWIELLNNDGLLLKTKWLARRGVEMIEWEFPGQAKRELEGLHQFLTRFIPEKFSSLGLRRAEIPSPPDSLPKLTDPAANDPDEMTPINDRFFNLQSSLLSSDERAYAWAMFPTWYEDKGYAQILLVTNRCLRIIHDPNCRKQEIFEVSLADISSLEYVASILDSYIQVAMIDEKQVRKIRKMSFPYSAEKAFHTCFEALRKCIAVLPLGALENS